MNLKRKLTTSLMTMGLVSALVGGATFAIFTDASTNANNTFKAGTVNVEAGAQNYGAIAIDNMAPGDTIDGSFVVQNVGSLELRFDTSANATGDLFSGANGAIVTITNPTDVVVGAGGSATVNYTVSLPLAADNTYQDVSGNLSFTVDAEQTKNN